MARFLLNSILWQICSCKNPKYYALEENKRFLISLVLYIYFLHFTLHLQFIDGVCRTPPLDLYWQILYIVDCMEINCYENVL